MKRQSAAGPRIYKAGDLVAVEYDRRIVVRCRGRKVATLPHGGGPHFGDGYVHACIEGGVGESNRLRLHRSSGGADIILPESEAREYA
jgi:hypothetical protein